MFLKPECHLRVAPSPSHRTHIFQRLWFRFYYAYLFRVVFFHVLFFRYVLFFVFSLSIHFFFFSSSSFIMVNAAISTSRDCQLYAAMNTNRQVSPTYVCCTVISAVVHVVESHQTPSLLRLLSSPLPMCTILCPVPRQIWFVQWPRIWLICFRSIRMQGRSLFTGESQPISRFVDCYLNSNLCLQVVC